MLKAGRLQWLLLALSGLWLLITMAVVNAGGEAFAAQVGSGGGECTSRSHNPSFGGTVIVGPGEVLCSELTAFGGTVEIQGEVRGNIIAFNSEVIIDGGVTGNITLIGGSVSMHKGSHIHGDINLYGAQGQRDGGAQVDGIVRDHARNPWSLADTRAFSFPFWFIVILAPLGLLFTWLLPEHVMFVRATVTSKMWRSLLLGVLTSILAPVVLLVLVALIISIPLALVVLLGLLAGWALGIVAIGAIIGDHIIRALAPQHNTRYLQVIVGLIALALLGSLPIIGWLISIGAGLLGLGAVFLSRFGTRLYSQPRQPLTL